MSDTERDNQFLGFAKCLWKELEVNIDFIPEGRSMRKTFLPMVERIIAQHAYDLVEHVIAHAPDSVLDADDWNIPDMPVLPDERKI